MGGKLCFSNVFGGKMLVLYVDDGYSVSVVGALLISEFEGNMDLRFWLFTQLERLRKG